MVGLTATIPLRDAGLLYVWGDGCITIMIGFIISFGLIMDYIMMLFVTVALIEIEG